eukprot:UN13462
MKLGRKQSLKEFKDSETIKRIIPKLINVKPDPGDSDYPFQDEVEYIVLGLQTTERGAKVYDIENICFKIRREKKEQINKRNGCRIETPNTRDTAKNHQRIKLKLRLLLLRKTLRKIKILT